MQPPTPTALPTLAPDQIAMGMDVPQFNLWDSAPHAIQTWNSAAVVTTSFQAIILVGLIYLIAMGLWDYFQGVGDDLQ